MSNGNPYFGLSNIIRGVGKDVGAALSAPAEYKLRREQLMSGIEAQRAERAMKELSLPVSKYQGMVARQEIMKMNSPIFGREIKDLVQSNIVQQHGIQEGGIDQPPNVIPPGVSDKLIEFETNFDDWAETIANSIGGKFDKKLDTIVDNKGNPVPRWKFNDRLMGNVFGAITQLYFNDAPTTEEWMERAQQLVGTLEAIGAPDKVIKRANDFINMKLKAFEIVAKTGKTQREIESHAMKKGSYLMKLTEEDRKARGEERAEEKHELSLQQTRLNINKTKVELQKAISGYVKSSIADKDMVRLAEKTAKLLDVGTLDQSLINILPENMRGGLKEGARLSDESRIKVLNLYAEFAASMSGKTSSDVIWRKARDAALEAIMSIKGVAKGTTTTTEPVFKPKYEGKTSKEIFLDMIGK